MKRTGLHFILDGIPSLKYGLMIFSKETGLVSIPQGGNLDLITDKTFRSSTQTILGAQYSKPLTFDLQICSELKFDRIDIATIGNWLFGCFNYRKLQIIQDDLYDVYYNCILTNPNILYVGANPIGFSCTVVCDAPWAWEFPRVIKKKFVEFETNTFDFLNISDDPNGLHPIIRFTMAEGSTDFSITNCSFNNLKFAWAGLAPNETIEVDNQTLIIKSSSEINRINNFNKNFMSFVKGINRLECKGKVKDFQISFQNARMVGG